MMKTDELPSTDNPYFQRLSFGGTLGRMLVIYKQGFRELNQLMLVVGGSYTLLWACLLLVLVPAFGIDGSNDDKEYVQANAPAFLGLFCIQWAIALLFGVVGHAAMVRVTTDVYLQRSTSTMRSYIATGVRLFCVNLCASILMGLGIGFGLVLLIVPGLYVGIMWVLTHAGIVVEGAGATAAMKRSWSLVSGRWCYVFGTKAVVVIPFAILNHLWIANVAPPMFTSLGFIVSVIPSIIIGPFLSVLVTAIYINLRVEKEGLDAQALANDIGEPQPDVTSNDEAGTTGENSGSDSDEGPEVVQVPAIV